MAWRAEGIVMARGKTSNRELGQAAIAIVRLSRSLLGEIERELRGRQNRHHK